MSSKHSDISLKHKLIKMEKKNNTQKLISTDINSNTSKKIHHRRISFSQTALPPITTQILKTQTMNMKELNRIQKILEKSEQSMLTSVSSGRPLSSWSMLHSSKQSSTTSTLTRPLTSDKVREESCSKNLTSINPSSDTLTSFNNPNLSVNTNLNTTSPIYHNHISKLKTSTLPTDIGNIHKQFGKADDIVAEHLKISINNNNNFAHYDQFSPLTYLPAIQEESFNSSMLALDSNIHDPSNNTVPRSDIQTDNNLPMDSGGAQTLLSGASTCHDQAMVSGITTGTQTSQTFLLALPDNFNIDQFSNQTLNLDYNSQQVLRALLQPNLSTEQQIVSDNPDNQELTTDKQQLMLSDNIGQQQQKQIPG